MCCRRHPNEQDVKPVTILWFWEVNPAALDFWQTLTGTLLDILTLVLWTLTCVWIVNNRDEEEAIIIPQRNVALFFGFGLLLALHIHTITYFWLQRICAAMFYRKNSTGEWHLWYGRIFRVYDVSVQNGDVLRERVNYILGIINSFFGLLMAVFLLGEESVYVRSIESYLGEPITQLRPLAFIWSHICFIGFCLVFYTTLKTLRYKCTGKEKRMTIDLKNLYWLQMASSYFCKVLTMVIWTFTCVWIVNRRSYHDEFDSAGNHQRNTALFFGFGVPVLVHTTSHIIWWFDSCLNGGNEDTTYLMNGFYVYCHRKSFMPKLSMLHHALGWCDAIFGFWSAIFLLFHDSFYINKVEHLLGDPIPQLRPMAFIWTHSLIIVFLIALYTFCLTGCFRYGCVRCCRCKKTPCSGSKPNKKQKPKPKQTQMVNVAGIKAIAVPIDSKAKAKSESSSGSASSHDYTSASPASSVTIPIGRDRY